MERVARSLAPGGRGYVLCNWIDRGGSWSDPVRGWLASLDTDAVVARVRELTPSEYAAVWTRALPAPERLAAATEWAGALEVDGVQRIHVGVIALGRSRVALGRSSVALLERGTDDITWRTVEGILAA